MSNSHDTENPLELEGTTEEVLDMAHTINEKLHGFEGVKEYMSGRQWRIEFTEQSLILFLVELNGIEPTDAFANAIGERLLEKVEGSKTYVSGGHWKWEFTHDYLINLCLWIRKNFAS